MTSSDERRSAACPTDQLRWFVNRTLPPEEQAEVVAHLATCTACQEEVGAWTALRQAMRSVAAQAPEPRADLLRLIERRLDVELDAKPAPQATPGVWLRRQLYHSRGVLAVAGQHLLAQAWLIRRDLFWAPLFIVPIVVVLALLPIPAAQAMGAVALLAALLAAIGMAVLYGQQVDPAREIALATPTSPRLVLGVRCLVVFGYDALLNCGLILPFLAWRGSVTPGWFVTNWLAPLCCLSAIALLLSILLNASAAALACVLLWMLRLLSGVQALLLGGATLPQTFWQQQYEAFWRQGPLLFVIAGLACALAFGLVERKERFTWKSPSLV